MILLGGKSIEGEKQNMDRVDEWTAWEVVSCVAGGLAVFLGLIYLVTWTVKHAWFG